MGSSFPNGGSPRLFGFEHPAVIAPDAMLAELERFKSGADQAQYTDNSQITPVLRIITTSPPYNHSRLPSLGPVTPSETVHDIMPTTPHYREESSDMKLPTSDGGPQQASNIPWTESPRGLNLNRAWEESSNYHDPIDSLPSNHDNTHAHSFSQPSSYGWQGPTSRLPSIATKGQDFYFTGLADHRLLPHEDTGGAPAASGSGGLYHPQFHSSIPNGTNGSRQYDTNSLAAPSSTGAPRKRRKQAIDANITSNKRLKPKVSTSYQPPTDRANDEYIAPKSSSAVKKKRIPCIFEFAGCDRRTKPLTSKNDWKRHIQTLHFATKLYCCSVCPSAGRPTFYRLDLFREHLVRQHHGVLGLKMMGDKIRPVKDQTRDAKEEVQKAIQCSEEARCELPSRLLCGVDACHQTVDDLSKFLDHILACHSMPCDFDACLGLGRSEASSSPPSPGAAVYLGDWCTNTGVITKEETGWKCHRHNKKGRQ